MTLVETFLFLMIIVTLLNGLIFFRKLIKLQKKNNELLEKLLEKERGEDASSAMPHAEIEKLRTEFMKTPYERKR
tara:strand:- start:108 stop:332 length:225 start_codon:yes stop_codon:yes gene_type:complete